MLTLFKGGKVFLDQNFVSADLLVAFDKILQIGNIDEKTFLATDLDVEVIDCGKQLVAPGIIDPHIHLSGGSGESGFYSQTPAIFVSECILGGITTVVGTIGVDTTTRSMNELIGRVKAFNEVGLSAYAYTGGYDMPPRTITKSVREDLIFLPEIIGVGEVAIADHRAPEPTVQELARASIDAYIGGILSNKPGVTHFHVGKGKKRVETVKKLLEEHEVLPENLYLTHVDRSPELFADAVELARRGCFIDIDSYERDVCKWVKKYRDLGGPPGHFTFSSDAGVPAAFELWEQVRDSALKEDLPLAELLPFVTTNTCNALKLKKKGRMAKGNDADIIVINEADLSIHHVYAKGKSFFKHGKLNIERLPHSSRRGIDIYGVIEKSI